MREVLKWFEDNIYYSVGSGNVSFSIHNGDLWEFEKLLKEQDKQLDELEEENELLHSIIKEVREYVEENLCYSTCDGMKYTMPSGKSILEILDKENK